MPIRVDPADSAFVYLIGHDSLSPDVGGGSQRLISVAKALQERGVTPVLVGPSDKTQMDAIQVLQVRGPAKGWLELWNVLAYNWRLFRLLKRRIPSARFVVVHNAIASWIPGLLARRAHVPFCLD